MDLDVNATEFNKSISNTSTEYLPWYPELETGLFINRKILPPIYTFLGIIGNIISFMVTTSKENRRISTCVYMSSLALMDTIVLLSLVAYFTMFTYGQNLGMEERNIEIAILCVWYTGNTFGMSSGFFLAMMSVDRAFAITFPLKAKKFCTTSRAKKAVIFAFLLPALLNINFFFTYRLHREYTGGITEVIDYPSHPWVETVVNMYILLLGTVIPFSVISLSNLIIIIKVQRASRDRQKMASNADEGERESETHLTRMLITVSLAYLFLSIPLRLADVVLRMPAIKAVYDLTDHYWRTRYSLVRTSFFTPWYMNYAVNFYLYFLGGGKKFRSDAKKVVGSLFNCMKH